MKNKAKIFIIFLGCLFFRLIPLRAPNLEPIMASIMPVGKRNGALAGFAFGFFSIVLYDLLTNFGIWTWTVAVTYGLIGVFSFFYFRKYQASRKNFVLFAFFATIVFDFITGVLFAPIFGQTILNAFVLQIPFTILHLAGNVGFAFFLSPILNKWLVSEKVFSFNKNPKMSLVK